MPQDERRQEAQQRLYITMLNLFSNYKDKYGLDHDTAFEKARLKLIEAALFQMDIQKEELAAFWRDMKAIQFTQQLALDYAKNKKAAANEPRPFRGLGIV